MRVVSFTTAGLPLHVHIWTACVPALPAALLALYRRSHTGLSQPQTMRLISALWLLSSLLPMIKALS
jgi:hypothetical protein